MVDLHCMSFTSKGISEILVAGQQDFMFVIDVNKGEVTKQVRRIITYIGVILIREDSYEGPLYPDET